MDNSRENRRSKEHKNLEKKEKEQNMYFKSLFKNNLMIM